jgi:hypothetical protein
LMYTKEFPGKVVGPLGGVGWSVCKRPRGNLRIYARELLTSTHKGGSENCSQKGA